MQAAAVISGDFVNTGGQDMANYALARRLADTQVETHVVAHHVANNLKDAPGVVCHRVRRPLRSNMLGSPLLDMRGRAVAKLLHPRRARIVVNGGNCQVYDVNWVHYVHAAYASASRAHWLRRLKGRIKRPIDLAQERTAISKAELVIANSARTKRDLEQHLGVESKRIQVVYFGVDADRFAPADEERRQRARAALGLADRPAIAFVGALGDRRKGFDTLYDAWKQLCGKPSWDGDLFVVGRGAELEAWRERAKRDALDGRVRFLGFRRDVPEILAACDALVAPTRYEPYGLGVHEALCCGLPSIVTIHAGVAERFPEALQPLLLQDPESATELAHLLQAWRSGAASFRASALELSTILRQRTWEAMADEIIAALS